MKKLLYFLSATLIFISCKQEEKTLNNFPVIEVEDYRITVLRDEQSEISTLMNKIIISSREPDKSILISELTKKYPSKFRNININEFNKNRLKRFLNAINENYKKEIHFQSLLIKKEKLEEKKQEIMDNANFK